jgi:hypothetical protein
VKVIHVKLRGVQLYRWVFDISKMADETSVGDDLHSPDGYEHFEGELNCVSHFTCSQLTGQVPVNGHVVLSPDRASIASLLREGAIAHRMYTDFKPADSKSD